MEFRQLEAFVNVVKFKSFSKAADACFLTQPSITMNIQSLEAELGAKLLERQGRTVEATTMGQNFYKYAVEILSKRDNAIDAIVESKGNLSGALEISSSSIPEAVFLPDAITGFARLYPDVQFIVHSSDTMDTVNDILERKSEIGFIGENTKHSKLDSIKIFDDEIVLISNKNMSLPTSISLGEIVKQPIIWRETGSATRRAFESSAEQAGFSRMDFKVKAIINDYNTIFRLIAGGFEAISVVSKRIAQSQNLPDIQISQISELDSKREFYMIYEKSRNLSPIASRFVANIIEDLK